MVALDSIIFFPNFSPLFPYRFPHTMDMEMYRDFLNNIDTLLDEGSPTMEELEIEAFGNCIWFMVNAMLETLMAQMYCPQGDK